MDMTCTPFSRVSNVDTISLETGFLVGKNTNNVLKALKNIVCKARHAAEWLADFL